MKTIYRGAAFAIIIACVGLSLFVYGLTKDLGDGVPRDGLGREKFPPDMVFTLEVFTHPVAIGWKLLDLTIAGVALGMVTWLFKRSEKLP